LQAGEKMKELPPEEFLKEMGSVGITLDPKYPKSGVLIFEGKPDIDRFWVVPTHIGRITRFCRTIISLVEPRNSIFVWRPEGEWSTESLDSSPDGDIQALFYRGMGIKNVRSDILVFDRQDTSKLIALIFNQLIFGFSVGDDLYIIPDNGTHIMKTSHDDVVHVSFPAQKSMSQFVDAMAAKSFELPDELPDLSFKKPDWMK